MEKISDFEISYEIELTIVRFTLYYNDKSMLHRISGPAIEYSICESKRDVDLWFINGKKINVNSQEEFEKYLKLLVFI